MAKVVTWRGLRHYWTVYLLVVPSLLMVGVFKYYTAVSAFYHSFFRWNGDTIKRYVGMAQFEKYLGHPWMWFGMAALTLFVMATVGRSSRASKTARWTAGVVLPAVNAVWIVVRGAVCESGGFHWPGLLLTVAWILVLAAVAWASRDSRQQVRWLVLTGMMAAAEISRSAGVNANLSWSLAILGMGLYFQTESHSGEPDSVRRSLQAIAGAGVIMWSLAIHAGGDRMLWHGFYVVAILVVANLFKMIPSILTAVVIHRLKSDRANYWYRVLFVVPLIIPGMVSLLIWKFFFEPNGLFNVVLDRTGAMTVLVWLDRLLGWGGVFPAGVHPMWLGSADLVIPAMILWGFPWVGVIGVLIYLSGLQSIDKSIYEAAEVDGVSSFGRLIHIELPLIMSQVRITLILMIIGTLQSYGQVLVLFGDSGGPRGQLMIPGLQMFRSAFLESQAGEACCIGLIVFLFILLLTEFNNRFVKVDK